MVVIPILQFCQGDRGDLSKRAILKLYLHAIELALRLTGFTAIWAAYTAVPGNPNDLFNPFLSASGIGFLRPLFFGDGFSQH